MKVLGFLGLGFWRLLAQEIILRILKAVYDAIGRAFYPSATETTDSEKKGGKQ